MLNSMLNKGMICNYRVMTHSETRTWHDKNIHSVKHEIKRKKEGGFLSTLSGNLGVSILEKLLTGKGELKKML